MSAVLRPADDDAESSCYEQAPLSDFIDADNPFVALGTEAHRLRVGLTRSQLLSAVDRMRVDGGAP